MRAKLVFYFLVSEGHVEIKKIQGFGLIGSFRRRSLIGASHAEEICARELGEPP